MRQFYFEEGPLDTLLQISERPIYDGDLVSKYSRDAFVDLGFVERCQGYNIITQAGRNVIRVLSLRRMLMIPHPSSIPPHPLPMGGDACQAAADAGVMTKAKEAHR